MKRRVKLELCRRRDGALRSRLLIYAIVIFVRVDLGALFSLSLFLSLPFFLTFSSFFGQRFLQLLSFLRLLQLPFLLLPFISLGVFMARESEIKRGRKRKRKRKRKKEARGKGKKKRHTQSVVSGCDKREANGRCSHTADCIDFQIGLASITSNFESWSISIARHNNN